MWEGAELGTNPANHLHGRFHLSKYTALLKRNVPGLWSEIFFHCVGSSFFAGCLAFPALDPSCSIDTPQCRCHQHPPPTPSGP